MDIENGMFRANLLAVLVTGETCYRFGNPVTVVGLRPESGGTDIHHWLVTIRDGDNRKEVYIKTQ